jgi:hypothetical protein
LPNHRNNFSCIEIHNEWAESLSREESKVVKRYSTKMGLVLERICGGKKLKDKNVYIGKEHIGMNS